MDFTTLLYERDGRIARITLNRPERLNAINGEMPGEIAAAVARANDDDGAHVIVLRHTDPHHVGRFANRAGIRRRLGAFGR